VLIAGDMLELGPGSVRFHAQCGKEAVRAGIDLIVGVGPESEALIAAARDAGADRERAVHVQDAVAAGDFLSGKLVAGDLVLLKGSRGVKLEQALDTLRLTYASLEP
jgi:UDP-N-acetylmuramoyl-tripeptide--D-alanyl-D-alanine ligase